MWLLVCDLLNMILGGIKIVTRKGHLSNCKPLND